MHKSRWAKIREEKPIQPRGFTPDFIQTELQFFLFIYIQNQRYDEYRYFVLEDSTLHCGFKVTRLFPDIARKTQLFFK